MLENAVARYKEVQITTSSPGELLLALYSGLFRFLLVAKHTLKTDRARASDALSRSHAIVSELYLALDYGVAPELCANLESVYTFCLEHLTKANLKNDVQAIDDVIRVLTPLKEAWAQAVVQAAREQHGGAR